jgi:hypothetical protein
MKKQIALVLALGATVLATGCGWMTCNKSKDDAKKAETTEVKGDAKEVKSDAKEAAAK